MKRLINQNFTEQQNTCKTLSREFSNVDLNIARTDGIEVAVMASVFSNILNNYHNSKYSHIIVVVKNDTAFIRYNDHLLECLFPYWSKDQIHKILNRMIRKQTIFKEGDNLLTFGTSAGRY